MKKEGRHSNHVPGWQSDEKILAKKHKKNDRRVGRESPGAHVEIKRERKAAHQLSSFELKESDGIQTSL